jgi:hypothetical protein
MLNIRFDFVNPVSFMRVRGGREPVFFVIAVASLAIAIAVRAQTPSTVADQLSTEDRVRKPGWWPTKGTPTRDQFAGPAACAECHASLVASQKQHSMARTSTSGSNSEILRQSDGKSFRIETYSYNIARTVSGIINYSVSDGAHSMSAPISWSFGTGKVGQSYLLEENGRFREVRFTYFHNLQTFAITPNQSISSANSLDKAAGRIVADDEVHKCFGCHTTASTTGGKFDPSHLILGVTCEGCHGPGADHVAVKNAGIEAGSDLIVNPGRFTPADSVDFCGACHVAWWDARLSGSQGLANVRFQPYRLENSRCWGKGDVRITCIACHNPHQPLVRDRASYDPKCLACHVTEASAKPSADKPGAACPVAKQDCVGCHMPKFEAPNMHFEFTDHQIRVVRKDEVFPN